MRSGSTGGPGNIEQERYYLARRSAQTAIYKITDAIARLIAPILSFTADEVWKSFPAHATASTSPYSPNRRTSHR